MLLPPLPQLSIRLDLSSACMDKLEHTMCLSTATTHWVNKKVNSLGAQLSATRTDNANNNKKNASQSSLSQNTIMNFSRAHNIKFVLCKP